MTIEIGILLAIFAALVYLFLTEKLPIDLTALLGLAALVFGGYVTPAEAFSGFASPAVITTLFIFVLGGALQQTGVADAMGAQAHRLAGQREVWLIVVVMLTTGLLSAFMPNIAATAVMMPAVASLAQRAAVPPSRLFMPLSFAAVLGGTTTLVGTPPNILAGTILQQRGEPALGLFDFTPVGGALLALGILYMVTIGRRLLPDRGVSRTPAAGRDLARVYQLEERLLSIRIPEGSRLDGTTLGEAQLGRALRAQVLAIRRRRATRLAPDATTRLRAGDLLLVSGRLDVIEDLLRVRGIHVEQVAPDALPSTGGAAEGLRMQVGPHSALCGQTLREAAFRATHGAVVIGIERGGKVLQERLAEVRLQAGDTVLAVGPRERLARFLASGDPAVQPLSVGDLARLPARFFLVDLPAGSPLAGLTLGASKLGELVGLTVIGLVRDGRTRLGLDPDAVLTAGDRLVVGGDPAALLAVVDLGDLDLGPGRGAQDLESDAIGVAEATIAPRSQLAGQTLRRLAFRERHGVQVVALWREGQPRRADLADVALRFGDALLLQGPREKLQMLADDPDLVMLTPLGRPARRTRRAPVALGGLALLIGLVVSGWQPIEVAAFAAGVAVVLGGALSMQEAYRAVEWRMIFLLAAILPLAVALERTGAAALAAGAATDLAGPHGPHVMLAVLVVLASVLSQSLDSGPAVVILAPVALEIAQQMGLAPVTILLAIALGASAAFTTPFSHKAHLLVMGAGGYRARDYLLVGTPLTVLVLVLIILLVPVVMPLR